MINVRRFYVPSYVKQLVYDVLFPGNDGEIIIRIMESGEGQTVQLKFAPLKANDDSLQAKFYDNFDVQYLVQIATDAGMMKYGANCGNSLIKTISIPDALPI